MMPVKRLTGTTDFSQLCCNATVSLRFPHTGLDEMNLGCEEGRGKKMEERGVLKALRKHGEAPRCLRLS